MYGQPSFLTKALGIITWSSLALLIPLAGLGFLSEGSVPGEHLYPVKRGIEKIVMTLQTFDKNALALYTVNLVDKRFSETEKLIADNPILLDTSQVNDFTDQIESARNTINTVSDPVQRKELRQKLIQNISDYRSQLATIQSPSQVTSYLAPTHPVSQQGVQPTQQTIPTPTPTQPPVNQQNQSSANQEGRREENNYFFIRKFIFFGEY